MASGKLLSNCACKNRGSDLRAAPILEKNLQYYGGRTTCELCGEPAHYSRLIGVYSWESDRTIAWQCPDCEHTEDRD